VTIDLDEGAGIGSWDLRAARHALTGVLRRRPEAYHDTLREHERQVAAEASVAAAAAGATPSGASPGGSSEPAAGSRSGAGAASIHDRVQVKEAGLGAYLVYDDYERRSGLVRILPADANAASWGAGGRAELADLATGPFKLDRLGAEEVVVSRDGKATIDRQEVPLSVETQIRLGGGRLDPLLEWSTTIENRGDRALVARIGVEWAITMLGGGGNPDAWWEIAGERARHDGAGASSGIERVAQGNAWLGMELASTIEPAADAWHAPIETVSNSEAGFERVYQGSALLLSWPLSLAPGARWSASITHRAYVAVDRAVDEAVGQSA
ncbi:MAG: alpha-amylase/4-alpha-glucanotransferase domain-containing protein, partial [Candidatus Limnocylindrales bacterium]